MSELFAIWLLLLIRLSLDPNSEFKNNKDKAHNFKKYTKL